MFLKCPWPLSKFLDFFLWFVVRDVGLSYQLLTSPLLMTSCLQFLCQLLLLLLGAFVCRNIIFWSPPCPLRTNVFLTQRKDAECCWQNSSQVQLFGFAKAPNLWLGTAQGSQWPRVFFLELKEGYPFPCSAAMRTFFCERKGLQWVHYTQWC